MPFKCCNTRKAVGLPMLRRRYYISATTRWHLGQKATAHAMELARHLPSCRAMRSRDVVRLCLLELQYPSTSEVVGIFEVQYIGNGSLMGFGRPFGHSYAVSIGSTKYERHFRRKSFWCVWQFLQFSNSCRRGNHDFSPAFPASQFTP